MRLFIIITSIFFCIISIFIIIYFYFDNKQNNSKKGTNFDNKQNNSKKESLNKNILSWEKQLDNWENEKNIPFYDKNILSKNNNFLKWMTSPIKDGDIKRSEYIEKFFAEHYTYLNNDIDFIDHLDKYNHKRFLSSSNNILISPKFNKNYKSIKEFIDLAPINEQKSFWKFVAQEIRKILNENPGKTLYIFTDGTSVPYLHVRIQINLQSHYMNPN